MERTQDALENKIEEAYHIAVRCLRRCYGKEGIYAGSRHFKNYWARDSLIGLLASINLNDYEIAKSNIELFLNLSKKDKYGKIVPLRIGDPNIILSFLGIHTNHLVPRYSQDKGNNHALDPNLWMIIAIDKYLEKTKDKSFLENNRKNIEDIIYWCVNQMNKKRHLIPGGKYSTWQDSTKKEGYTLYNNVLLYEATKRAGTFLDDDTLKDLSVKIKNSINEMFWNNKFYDDFFKIRIKGKKETVQKYSIFATFENTLAILFDVADNNKAHCIENYILNSDINDVVPSLTNYQPYPKSELSLRMRIAGMGDYHNHSMAWLFIGLSDTIAKDKIGFKREAKDELRRIAEIIIRDKTVYECYETRGMNKGNHVNRILYRSEEDFAISSSFYILAYESIMKNKRFYEN